METILAIIGIIILIVVVRRVANISKCPKCGKRFPRQLGKDLITSKNDYGVYEMTYECLHCHHVYKMKRTSDERPFY